MSSKSHKKKEFIIPDSLHEQVSCLLKATELLLKHHDVLDASTHTKLMTLLQSEHCPQSAKQTVRAVIVNAVQLLPEKNGLVLCELGLVPEIFTLIEDAPSPAHAQAAVNALNLVLLKCEEALLGEDDSLGVVAACANYASDTNASYKLRLGAITFLTEIVNRKGKEGVELLARKNALGCFPAVLVEWAPMPAHYQDNVFSNGVHQCLATLNALLPIAPEVVLSGKGVIGSVLSVISAHSPVAQEAVAFLLTVSTTPEGCKAIMSEENHGYTVIGEWLPLYEEEAVRCNMIRVLTNLCVDDENARIIGEAPGMLECLHDTLANTELDSTLWECTMRCLNNILSCESSHEKWVKIGGLTTLIKHLRKSSKIALIAPLFIVIGNMMLASENARTTLMAEHGDKMFISLLDHADSGIVEQASRSLCNICSCSREARKAIIANNGLTALLRLAPCYDKLPKAANYAMEAIVSLSDCPIGIEKMIADPDKGVDIMRSLIERAQDRQAPAELRSYALGALTNISRSNSMRILFIQTIPLDPLLDIIVEAAADAAKDPKPELVQLTSYALSTLTNFAADGRTRLWFKKLDPSKRTALEEVEKNAAQGSQIQTEAQKVLETLGFLCEDTYPIVVFGKVEEVKAPDEEIFALDQMDLESLQMHLEEQQKVTNNAQIAYDFAQQETAEAKKECQHEKKTLMVAQHDHSKNLKKQREENEKINKEQETVGVPAEKEKISKTLMEDFETKWVSIMHDLKKKKKMKADAIEIERNKMKQQVMKKIEVEQERCVLRNEVRKEKAATELHVRKMRFMLEERAIAHAYHCSKFIYCKAQDDEKDAKNALDRENAKLTEIENLIEKVLAAQKAEEERQRKQRELEQEQLKQAGASETEIAAKFAKEQEEAKKKQQHQRRTFIVNEIRDTEENYVDGLSHVLTVYRAPLLDAQRRGKKSAILTLDQINSIFSNLESIRDYNAVFLDLLKTRLTQWGPDTLIGDLFVVISKLFMLYSEYVNNYSHAIDVLGKLRNQIPAFSAFMNEADKENVNLKLVSVLIFPIQRIPRYILLIQDLLKHTSIDHPDYHNLEEALESMNKTGKLINESKREAENTSKLAEINQSLKGKHPSFQKAGRYFVCETAVTLVQSGSKNPLHGMLYIGTDFLLIIHAVGRGLFQYDETLDLALSEAVKSKETQTALEVSGPTITFDDEKDRKHYNKTDKKTGKPEQHHYVFAMKSLPDINRWYSKIMNAKKDLLQPKQEQN